MTVREAERLQGYFYGKPMPINDFFQHVEEFGIEIEKRQWRHYYDTASFHARRTDVPLSLIEDFNGELRTLFMNEAYEKQIFDKHYDLEVADQIRFHSGSPLTKKSREYADTMEQTRNLETFYCPFRFCTFGQCRQTGGTGPDSRAAKAQT